MPPRSSGAPPWWPEDEEWPPADWRMARRRFIPRMAALMLGLLLVAFVFCVVIGGLFWVARPNRNNRPRHLFVPVIALFLLSLLFLIAARYMLQLLERLAIAEGRLTEARA